MARDPSSLTKEHKRDHKQNPLEGTQSSRGLGAAGAGLEVVGDPRAAARAGENGIAGIHALVLAERGSVGGQGGPASQPKDYAEDFDGPFVAQGKKRRAKKC